MMNASHIPALLLALASVVILGCDGTTNEQSTASAPANERPLPKTMTEAVTQLSTIRDTIKTAFDAGSPHDCDEALHQAAKLVMALPDIATAESLSEEATNTVVTESKALFDCFVKIHDGFHGNSDGPELSSYTSVAEGIDQAIAALANLPD